MQFKLKQEKVTDGVPVVKARGNHSAMDLTRGANLAPMNLKLLKMVLYIFVAAKIVKMEHCVTARTRVYRA
jgi:transcription initiation factor IIE alpha subunit